MFNKKLKKLKEELKLTVIANSILKAQVDWLKTENRILLNQLKMCALDLAVWEIILGLAEKQPNCRVNPFNLI